MTYTTPRNQSVWEATARRTDTDSGTGVIFSQRALTVDLDGGGAPELLAEAAKAGVRAGARDGVVPQLVEETHPSPS
jgi:hypothetical protein